MVTICLSAVYIIVTMILLLPPDHFQKFDPMLIEKWPIIQVYGIEEVGGYVEPGIVRNWLMKFGGVMIIII